MANSRGDRSEPRGIYGAPAERLRVEHMSAHSKMGVFGFPGCCLQGPFDLVPVCHLAIKIKQSSPQSLSCKESAKRTRICRPSGNLVYLRPFYSIPTIIWGSR